MRCVLTYISCSQLVIASNDPLSPLTNTCARYFPPLLSKAIDCWKKFIFNIKWLFYSKMFHFYLFRFKGKVFANTNNKKFKKISRLVKRCLNIDIRKRNKAVVCRTTWIINWGNRCFWLQDLCVAGSTAFSLVYLYVCICVQNKCYF